jgi:hypothetical protein
LERCFFLELSRDGAVDEEVGGEVEHDQEVSHALYTQEIIIFFFTMFFAMEELRDFALVSYCSSYMSFTLKIGKPFSVVFTQYSI